MMLTRCLLAGDAPTYVNGQLIAEETVLHHVSEEMKSPYKYKNGQLASRTAEQRALA